KLTEEKIRIESDLSRMMEERGQLTEQVGLLRNQNQLLAKQMQQYESFGTTDELKELGQLAEGLTQTVDAKKSTITQLQEELNQYKDLGTPEDIRTVFACTEDLVEYHRQIGPPEEVTKFLREADARLAGLHQQCNH